MVMIHRSPCYSQSSRRCRPRLTTSFGLATSIGYIEVRQIHRSMSPTTERNPMTDTKHADTINEMSTAAEDFYRFGWLNAASGNMSAKVDDETVLITASERHMRDLNAEDFVDIDFDAKPSGDDKPPSDAASHLAIYKNLDDVGAVYHVHHLKAALCSDRDHKRGVTHLHDVQMIAALDIEGDELSVDLPILDAGADDQADTIAEYLSGSDISSVPCLNIKNHGLYVWGADTEACRRHVEACAYLFDYAWRRPMSPEKSSSITGFRG